VTWAQFGTCSLVAAFAPGPTLPSNILLCRPADKIPMWWMHGTMEDKSIVEAVMKLLTDMSMVRFSTLFEY